MSLFTFFSGSGNNAFKKQVAVINDNDGLTDTEKMAAIDLLLNPVPAITDYIIEFSDGNTLVFNDNNNLGYGVY